MATKKNKLPTAMQIARYHRFQKDRGWLTSKALAFTQNIAQNIDPRNLINDYGEMRLFLGKNTLKGYRAPGGYTRSPSRTSGDSGGLGTQEIVNKISELNAGFDRFFQKSIDTSIHTKNVAKHTSLIPRMASDTNITRKNIQKIAKVLGAKPTDKADRYFQNFDVREREYESKFRRERGRVRETSTPSREGGDGGRGGGILSKLLGTLGKGVGLAAIGAGIGGFLYGISLGVGALNKMGGATGLKDLLVNLAEGLKAFDAKGLAIMGTLLVGGALFGRYAGGPLGIKTVGAALGITAIGAGIGGFMAAMSLASTYSGDNGRSAKELMTNIAEGFNAFDVNSMIAMGALIGAGGLFGAYEGRSLAGGDLKSLGEFGGAVMGITAIGLGIGGFMSALSQAARLSGDDGESAKITMQNFAAGMNALGGVNMAILGGIMALGAVGGGIAGAMLATGNPLGVITFVAGLGGIAGIGGAIGLFLAALSGAATLSEDRGQAARDILVNLGTGLKAFDSLSGENILNLGKGFKSLAEGLRDLFLQDIWNRIRQFFTGASAKDTFTALADNLKVLEKVNGTNLFNLGNGLHHLSLGLKNMAALTKEDLQNINGALSTVRELPSASTIVPKELPPAEKPTPTKTGYMKTSYAPEGSRSYEEKVGGRESEGKYNTTYGKAGTGDINGKPITENTVAEVIAWQDQMRKTGKNIHAAGKYQFMNVGDAARLANIPLDAKFDSATQEKMMQAYTKANAQTLKNLGIEPSESNLALAHAVGPGGVQKLLQAEASGQGNAIAADVLGLTGNARSTNKHLAKMTVSEYLSKMRGEHGDGGTPPVLAEKPDRLPKQEEEKKSSIFSLEGLKGLIPDFLKDSASAVTDYGGDLRNYIFGQNNPAFGKFSQLQRDIGSPEKLREFLDSLTGVAKISGGELNELTDMLTQGKEEMMMRSGESSVPIQKPIALPQMSQEKIGVSTTLAPVVDTDHMKYFMKWQSTSYTLI
jgi:hypothetical protein